MENIFRGLFYHGEDAIHRALSRLEDEGELIRLAHGILSSERKKLIFDQIAAREGLPSVAIEKDWWVMLILPPLRSATVEGQTVFVTPKVRLLSMTEDILILDYLPHVLQMGIILLCESSPIRFMNLSRK